MLNNNEPALSKVFYKRLILSRNAEDFFCVNVQNRER